MDLEENLNLSNSWIPVKALRSAADIKETLKKGTHRKTASSPSGSPSKNAISVEVKANSPTSNTIHFNSLHSRYNTATLDIIPVQQDLSDSLEKKYINNISRLNEEILIMSSQLKQANETIANLTQKLNDSNGKHALNLQSLHERHEQKIRRNRQDMDNLLKEVHLKSPTLALEKIILEKNLELEMQKRKFQEKIDSMSKQFESQIETKDLQHRKQIETLKDNFLEVVLSLKGRFFEEIEKLNKRQKNDIFKAYKEMEIITCYEVNDIKDKEEDKAERLKFVDNDKDFKRKKEEDKPDNFQENDDELQIIEESSSQVNLFIRKPMRESGESDLDMSLRQLINQINLEHEGSISEIMRS